ncbi:hypothetical protein ANCCAN_27288 [Ancylostoma caninum]|uniref:Uncharacterized protein n=1 Tax=Ancylostoma caninum TaxID=29170 RepID=A0A368F4D6_ANCCA|nr:hypothetical protein ANCCAN_27288 [Ancylostoma caninum]
MSALEAFVSEQKKKANASSLSSGFGSASFSSFGDLRSKLSSSLSLFTHVFISHQTGYNIPVGSLPMYFQNLFYANHCCSTLSGLPLLSRSETADSQPLTDDVSVDGQLPNAKNRYIFSFICICFFLVISMGLKEEWRMVLIWR